MRFLKSFSGKLILGGIVTTLTIFAFSLYSFIGINALSASQKDVNTVIDDIPHALFNIQLSFMREANLLSSLNHDLITAETFKDAFEQTEQEEDLQFEKIGTLTEQFSHIRFLTRKEKAASVSIQDALSALHKTHYAIEEKIKEIPALHDAHDAARETRLQNEIIIMRGELEDEVSSLNKNVAETLDARAAYAQGILESVLKSSFLFLTFLFILVFGVNMYLTLQTVFSLRPILRGIEETGKGNLAHRIRLHSEDEFGLIAQSFNEAANRIQEAQEKLEETNKQVRGQARELGEKVNALERFQKLTVGRELKMIELKKELEELNKAHGTS